jgi:prepilin-type N-terminal cleavage/methylation domain-containing protein
MLLKRTKHPSHSPGFSLIELVVVVGLIAILLAVSAPAISRYIRNYRIRGAVQQVAGELQQARATAVKQNVNLGVVFLVTRAEIGPNQEPAAYRFVIEDPIRPPDMDDPFLIDPTNSDRVFGERSLPQGVEFATTAGECPAAAQPPVSGVFAADNFAVRFTRLGAACVPTLGNPACPPVLNARTSVMMTTNPAGVVMCLREVRSGLSRTLILLPSGQVVTSQ